MPAITLSGAIVLNTTRGSNEIILLPVEASARRISCLGLTIAGAKGGKLCYTPYHARQPCRGPCPQVGGWGHQAVARQLGEPHTRNESDGFPGTCRGG